MSERLIIIGGGLAGSEAAWQAAERGVKVHLYEMRPKKFTGAHKTELLGELVCSNSLRSSDVYSAPGLLKKELSLAGSLIMEAAEKSVVPAGSALAVNRDSFAYHITERLSGHSNIRVIRKEVHSLPDSFAIVSTGPLTSEAMTNELSKTIGGEYLYFYDAIAPIIDADSLNYDKVYRGSRYGKGGDDYINCPMTQNEYEEFCKALIQEDSVESREFEMLKVFEGCMPIEEMAQRGDDTLRFGPMKPVGLPDPKTGKEPYAVVQLRPENREMTAYNMVGFQTRLKWHGQRKVFRQINGLESAEFLRYGSLHRNTFINSPELLNRDLTIKGHGKIFIAGQISGVEGYIESTAMGLVAGINASLKMQNRVVVDVPASTAHGALIKYITESDNRNFQPSNINFGLFPMPHDAPKIRDKKQKRKIIVEKAIRDWSKYLERVKGTDK
jgi:methylenetetrahydrofolate--tRNA-(uracil-5-)-methyltransferase